LEVEVLDYGSDYLEFKFEGEVFRFRKQVNKLVFQGREHKFSSTFIPSAESKQVFVDELEADVQFVPKAKKSSGLTGGAGSLQSPMPGKIFKVLKKEGDEVSAGEPILILEAMKMEHTIKAQQDGVVKKIHFEEGAQVQGGVELCEIE
ncbi:MAG: hypothetical protein KC478_03625, partial [Bacteriovoracaceae bacterium]|nr:hypothetical protein [Bacteriovoracaceae bacterium]